jgi:IQ calmodulin-binding motif
MKLWKEKKEKAIKVVLQFRIYKIKQKIKEGLRLVRWRTQCFTKIQAMWKGKKTRKLYLRKIKGTEALKSVNTNIILFLYFNFN